MIERHLGYILPDNTTKMHRELYEPRDFPEMELLYKDLRKKVLNGRHFSKLSAVWQAVFLSNQF
jgi:hypothetical protein